jgi:hypothetical protein
VTGSLDRVLALAGVGLPRGVLGPEAMELARAIAAGAPEERLAPLRLATSEAHWEDLRMAMGAALERARSRAEGPAAAGLDAALPFIADPSPSNPLALGLAERAGRSLAAVLVRVRERLEDLEERIDAGAAPLEAAALAAGPIVDDLLDLDPDDFAPEIAAYVAGGEDAESASELARATGDEEIRAWARESLWGLEADDTPRAAAALAELASGAPPEDPAEDTVWLATILTLAEEAIALALVAEQGTDRPDG